MYNTDAITEAVITHKIKVYVLFTVEGGGSPYIQEIKGVTSSVVVAAKFGSKNNCEYEEFVLNDPELLNRIAKESDDKNK